MTEEQKQTKSEKEEVYSKIEKTVRDIIYILPKAKEYWRNKIKPQYTNAVKDITQKVSQEVEKYTVNLTSKIKNSETKTSELISRLDTLEKETSQLRETNLQYQTKISQRETSLREVEEKYKSLKKEVLKAFSNEELDSEIYAREEESIKEAEAADGMEEMGFREAKTH